ncbi:hypothetical protein BJ742DRAFT_816735, partial [Cladochytrium replicatum]
MQLAVDTADTSTWLYSRNWNSYRQQLTDADHECLQTTIECEWNALRRMDFCSTADFDRRVRDLASGLGTLVTNDLLVQKIFDTYTPLRYGILEMARANVGRNGCHYDELVGELLRLEAKFGLESETTTTGRPEINSQKYLCPPRGERKFDLTPPFRKHSIWTPSFHYVTPPRTPTPPRSRNASTSAELSERSRAVLICWCSSFSHDSQVSSDFGADDVDIFQDSTEMRDDDSSIAMFPSVRV